MFFAEDSVPRVKEEYFENKRREIVDAAYRVCARKPITSIDMKDIIDEAGFSHGVIYKYYKDLDEVLLDLVRRINEDNRLNDKIISIFGQQDKKNWEEIIRDVCAMLADYMIQVGPDVLKISIYANMMAVSEPERAERIAGKLQKNETSPLIELISALSVFMKKVVSKNKLKPVKSISKILEYMVAAYHGIQTGYVLSNCYHAEQVIGKYKPKEMFSCLAESVILMINGKE
ncbi:MAG TPA: hypothetical protein DCM57_00930 [Treponema sp.]|nr:hypothetical protein [Treponema sp.]